MEGRPMDTLGPPSDPIPFPQAKYYYGKRANVLVYNPRTGQHDIVRNVLFRDYSRTTLGGEEGDDGDHQVKEAYWKVAHKSPIKTIMGHVEICRVLKRCSKDDGESQSDDDDNDDSSYGDDDDVVFQWTERLVAVKVNYCQRMEQLRNRHAEDPLKEIAAMQLIGDEHPHVLGCEVVLFDGKNLNVVLRYCDSGDLFQLLQDVQSSRAELPGEQPPGLSEGETRYWFRQIISGLQHLHSVGICHRDLSPENVMIDKKGTLIIDMGMCLRVPYQIADGADRTMDILEATALAHVSKNTPQRCLFKPQGACGKLPYMSPEIFRNRDSFDGEAADLWTAGTILFCMVTGNRSYQRPHASDPQFYWMTQGLSQLLSDWGVRLSPEGEHLLKNLLQVDPRLRLTLKKYCIIHGSYFPTSHRLVATNLCLI